MKSKILRDAINEAEENIIMKKMKGFFEDSDIGIITHSFGDVWVIFCFGTIITHKPVRIDAERVLIDLRYDWICNCLGIETNQKETRATEDHEESLRGGKLRTLEERVHLLPDHSKKEMAKLKL